MTLNELKEQLQHNLLTYLDSVVVCEFHESYLDSTVLDNVCDIVVDTFEDTFYDGSLTGIDLITKTLDTTPSN